MPANTKKTLLRFSAPAKKSLRTLTFSTNARRAPEAVGPEWRVEISWKFFYWAVATLEIAEIRATPGGKNLSPDMVLILCAVVFDDYLLFPTAAELAERS